MKQLSSFFLQILLSLLLTFQAPDYLAVIMSALAGMRYLKFFAMVLPVCHLKLAEVLIYMIFCDDLLSER